MSNRPTYESDGDIARERAVIARAAMAWHVNVRKLPRSYALDYALVRGRDVMAWAEVKVRSNESGAFPTYMLSLAKWARGVELARQTERPFLVIVQFADCTLFYKHREDEPVPVQFAGRTDRGDWEDAEPCAMLPLAQFMAMEHNTPWGYTGARP